MKKFSDLATWYFSKNAMPYWSVLLVDCICVIVATFLAFKINHGGEDFISYFYPLFGFSFIIIACFIVGFRTFHTYSGVIRYSSFSDLIRILLAVVVGLLAIIIVEFIFGYGTNSVGIEIADLIFTALFVAIFMWLIRIWIKTIYDNTLNKTKTTSVFIYGVKKGGIAIAKSINALETTPYKISGFATSEPDIKDKHLMGHKVFAYSPNLVDEMKKAGADALLVSPLMMTPLREDKETLDSLIDGGIKIYVVPNAIEWDREGNFDISLMRQVEPEDLLPRDKIEIDLKAAADMLEGNAILITGAAGSIGSEIVRQVATFNPKLLILVDQAETPMHDVRLVMDSEFPNVSNKTIVADITDSRMMERIFNIYRPEYVFHAAAYKHVPMMEDNPYEAVVNNVCGTKIIADLAVKYGTKKFVMVSTDKAVNPTNVMGCSKRICEIYVQSLDKALKEGKVKGETRFVTTRFGNVLGSNGSVIPIFQEQIKKGGPVTVTHPEIIRYFMLIPEACKLVIEAGTMGKGGEIFVFDMGEPVKIADLAKQMIKLSGAKNVEIKFTGLRDGEKLYEEVLNDKELTLPTFHPKIKIAKVREYNYATIEKEISDLIDIADKIEDMEIVAEMKRMVPEFKSNNSIYEKLDLSK